MGWDNPPVPWRELERRLSWDRTRRDGGEPAGVVRGRFGPQPAQDDGPPWAELHCHSSYSFLDGASSPAELVAEAARQGVRALALTDHDGMYGAAQFAQAAVRQAEQGIPVSTVFGAELSVGLGGRPPWNPPLRSAPRGGTSPTVLAPGSDPPEPPGCAPRPRGGTSPAHRPLTEPKGPVRQAGNGRLAVGPAAVPPKAPGRSNGHLARVTAAYPADPASPGLAVPGSLAGRVWRRSHGVLAQWQLGAYRCDGAITRALGLVAELSRAGAAGSMMWRAGEVFRGLGLRAGEVC
ncbi:MAG: PHP domain-containing protein, partial [Streptosporangiaceae bacterium]